MTQSFQDIVAWQKAHEFVVTVYRITRSFPEEERFGLASQFQRAAVSVAANIAEGYKKLSRIEKLRFLNIAQGSLEECRYYIILSRDLGYIDEECSKNLNYAAYGASRLLNAYCKGIKENNFKSQV